jgi:hypothetical protein
METRSPRRRLAGATLIGFDTSVWKRPPKRDAKGCRKAARRSKVLAAKVGVKTARRK